MDKILKPLKDLLSPKKNASKAAAPAGSGNGPKPAVPTSASLKPGVTPAAPNTPELPTQTDQVDRQQIVKQAQLFARGLIDIRDIIAPSGIEVDFNEIRIGSTYYRTYFIAGYPREVGPNWLAPLINFPQALDISMFYYPIDARDVLKNLRRKITEMQTELNIEYKEGRILDPEVQLALQDAKSLQDELVAERERFFQFALYITIPHEDVKQLHLICKQVESILAGILLLTRKATLQMDDGFRSTLPIHNDKLQVYRNMDTTSIASTFPFTSSSLTSDEGILYGINEHNGSLVVFDRFRMENANSVVFGKSGSGKSYTVKLEAIRYLLLGTEIIVIDPEQEFRTLSDVIGGEYITYDFTSKTRINPFDLSQVFEEGEDQLETKILVLHSLMKLMLGDMTASQEAVLDRALLETYRLKGISSDPSTQRKEPPLMEDLYKVFLGMEDEDAKELSKRLEKFVMGSAKGLFDQPTNIDIKNTFTVFGIRDLEETIRPIGMFLILDYIWTRVRRDRRKRLLFVDEAWIMMKNADSANFMHSLAKRARKYYLGITTISQDIEDFFNHEKGLAIIKNSSIQVLMKQSSSAIDKLADVFILSEGEQNLLLSANVGEGLFFAGQNHVAIQMVAGLKEHELITTNPAELQQIERMKQQQNSDDRIRKLQEQGRLTFQTPTQPDAQPAEQQMTDMTSAPTPDALDQNAGMPASDSYEAAPTQQTETEMSQGVEITDFSQGESTQPSQPEATTLPDDPSQV
ncbi:DUF87 domain-containing protein [candidate division WWE3 bacterium]|nr:DUF87 domain-containing protein [candidate division WWE3 bacterium]